MKISKETKIGIYTIVILFLTYWGINFLRGLDLLENRATYHMSVENATGITESTAIMAKGVKIGAVTSVTLSDLNSNIAIVLTAKAQYRIPKDSYIKLKESGLMDAPVLTLIPGKSDEFLESNDTIPYEIHHTLMDKVDTLSSKIFAIMGKVDTMMTGINSALSKQNIDNLSATMHNLERASFNANDMIVSQKDRLTRIMTNAEVISKTLKEATPQLKNALANFSNLSDSLSVSVPSLIANIDNLLKKVQSPDGTLGKMLNDDAVYQNLDTSLTSLSALLQDLKENPKRYVSLSLFERRSPEEKEKIKEQKEAIKERKKSEKK